MTPPGPKPVVVSVDDHLIEPDDLWQSRLPAKLRERGPRAVSTDVGLCWELDGERQPRFLVSASAGLPLDQRLFEPMKSLDQIRPGCYDPVERVRDMDEDGVLASLCFPTFPGFGGTRFNVLTDKTLAMACIEAYNDFQIDEWAGSAPGRLFGMVLLPYWDPELAVRELQRTAAKGAVAVAFTENPTRLGFPSIHDEDRYWDPVFAAAQDARLPLCMHFGSSSFQLTTSDDAPTIVSSVAGPVNSELTFIDWLFSGVLERFPQLQIVFSESYLGWVPFFLEHADRHWANHFAWAMDRRTVPRPPSEYFHEQVSVCLVYEELGASQIEQIGVERVLAEADYPHPDSQWPHTAKILGELLDHLAPADRRKVLRTNAEKLFRLDLAEL